MPGKVLTQGGTRLLNTFNGLKSTHRLHSIAAHGPSSAASYTGVFLEVPHAEQRLDVDIPDYIVDQQITMRSVQGWQPVFMSATGDASGARYAVVYEEGPEGIRSVQSQATWDELTRAGGEFRVADSMNWNLLSIDAFQVGPPVSGVVPTYFCTVFDRGASSRSLYQCELSHNPEESASNNDRSRAWRNGWSRPIAAVPINAYVDTPDNYLGLGLTDNLLMAWQTDTLVPWPAMPMESFHGGVQVHGPLWKSAFDELIDDLLPQQPWRWVIYVGAHSVGPMPRFCVVTADDGVYKPMHKSYTVRKPLVIKHIFRLPAFGGPRPGGGTGQAEDAGRLPGPSDDEMDEPPFRRLRDPVRLLRPMSLNEREHLIARPRLPRSPFVPSPQPEPPTEQPVMDSTFPLDLAIEPADTLYRRYMKSLMKQKGARGGQIAVARGHQLKVAYAITYAEQGYPPIELQHRLRIGSVSKFLTAMAAVRHFGPQGNAGTFFSSLAGEMEIPTTAHNLPYLNLIRVEELLRHRTGWGSSEAASFGEGEIQAAVGHAPPKPGDLRTFFALTHHDIMAPGALMYYTAEYNNWNFAVLGEVVSKAIKPGYGHYETAMWQFWGQMTGHIIRNGWSASRALNEPPCHLRLPGIWWNPEGTDPLYVPYQYAWAQPYAAAAGHWVISMVEMCRIASRLNPNAENPLLNATELAAFTQPYELPHQPGDDPSTYQVLPPPGGQGGGRGCYFFESTMQWGGGPAQPVWVLNHNGAVAGGCALLIHVIPKSGGGDPSVSIAIALNHDAGLGWQEIVDLVTIAQKAEQEGTWIDGDLFDQV